MPTRTAARSIPTQYFTLFAALLCCMVAISGLVGCKEANPPSAIPNLSENTPEAKLEEVMNRLRTAAADASAAEGSGIVSQRTVSHRLIPPTGDQGKYAAEVTIKTTIALAKVPPAATLPQKPKEEPRDPLAEEEEPVDPLLEEELEEEAMEELELPTNNGVTRRAIEQSRETTTKTYELVYDNERWKLVDEISAEDDEVAKYMFEFALAE